MVLKVETASEADAPRSAQIESLAYGPNPLGSVLYPKSSSAQADTATPESKSLNPRAAQLVALLRSDPKACKWVKVVDTDLPAGDDMVAFSCWYFWAEESPVQGPQTWGEGTNPEACEMFFGGMRERRNERFAGRPYAYLRLLHTHPDHKRRGAGSMLLKWGAAEADRLRLNSYLEASPEGKPLYEKSGFSEMETFVADFSKWGGPDSHATALMMRPMSAS